ncbi:MAG: hypothetical protein ACK559_20955, partial [bacterium]
MLGLRQQCGRGLLHFLHHAVDRRGVPTPGALLSVGCLVRTCDPRVQSSAVTPDEVSVAAPDRLVQVATDATDVIVHLLHLGFCSPQHSAGRGPGTSWRVALRVSGSRITPLCASDSAVACRVS